MRLMRRRGEFHTGGEKLSEGGSLPVVHSRVLWRAILLILVADMAGTTAGAPMTPQCGVRSGVEGGPAIVVNGQPRAPLFFSVNNQFHRDEILIQELEAAAAAGIPFFSFSLRLGWHATDEEAAATVDRFCAAHPNGYFLVHVWLGASPAWLDDHPADCVTKSDGTRIGYASPASAPWRNAAAALLRGRLEQIAGGPHGDRFLGVSLNYLNTAEWFFPDTNDYMDYSPANVQGFREWLRREYRRRGALRKAWNNPRADWDTAQIPTPEAREAAAWGPFRDPRSHQPAIDFTRYQSELIADTISYFARVVKEVTRGRSLAGVYYGYTMELNNNGPRALTHSGHLALGKLLQSKDIDLLFAPYSYFERNLGQPGHFHQPVDSIALHGKLAVIEEDTYTHLAQAPSEDLIAPGWPDRTANLEETLALTRRNYGNFLTHRCGMWFFDLLSDGRWNDPAFWESTLLLRRIAAELRSEPPFRPEVAFVVDEESVCFLRDTTYPILVHSLSWWRSELDRIGAPVGYYLQSDLGRLPDSVKVVILANPYRMDRKAQNAVRRLYRRGATVVWTYADGVVGSKAPDPGRIAALTGFPVAARFDDVPMRIVNELSGEVCVIDEQSWQPRFVLPGPETDPLARYETTGEICAAARPMGRGVAVYTAAPRLPVGLLRTICARSGVHLYRDTPGMTGVVGPYLFLHTAADPLEGDHRLTWPQRVGYVARIVPYSSLPAYPDAGGGLRAHLKGRETYIYRFETDRGGDRPPLFRIPMDDSL